MKKLARITGITLITITILLIVLVLAGRWWLLSTTSGSGFILNQAKNNTAEALQINRYEGNLSSGLVLHDIKFTDTGTQANIGTATVEISLGFLPTPQLQVKRIYADDISISLLATDDQTKQPKVGATSDLPVLKSPVFIQIDDLRLSKVMLQLPSTEAIQLESITAKLDYHQQLNIHKLSVKHANLNASLNGNSELTPPYQHRLQLSAQNQQFQLLPPQLNGIAVDLTSQGSLDLLNLELNTQNVLPLTLTAELRNILDQPSWDIQLNDMGQQLQWPPISEPGQNEPGQAPQAALAELVLSSKGNLNTGHISQLRTRVNHPDTIQGDWALSTAGENNTIRIESLTGTILAGQISANGELTADPADLLTSLAADLNIHLDNIQPLQHDNDDSPLANIAGVSGTLRMQAVDNIIKLQPLELSVPNTDWQLSGNAQYGLKDEQIAANIRWQQLSWPPQATASNESKFASQSGNLIVNGNLNQLQAHLKTDVLGQQIPATTIDLQATLEDQQLKVSPLLLSTLGGNIRLDGQFNIDTKNWQANLNAANIDPGLHWSEYPGKVNLQAKTSGQLETNDQALSALLEIDSLDGQLRDQPLYGEGKVHYSDGQLVSDGLSLLSGQAELNVQGGTEKAQVDINIPNLTDLLPDTSGQLSANLLLENLDPKSGIPAILSLDANATQLQWNDFRFKTLQLNSHLNSSIDGQPQTLKPNNLLSASQLTITDLQLPEQAPIESISLSIQTDSLQQQLSFQAQQASNQLLLKLSGSQHQWQNLDDWQQLITQGWEGQLDALNIKAGDTTAWTLQQPAIIKANADQQRLENLCLRAHNQAGEACISLQQYAAAESHAELQITQLPLSLLDQYLAIDLLSDQNLTGQAELAWRSKPDADQGSNRDPNERSSIVLQQLEADFNIDAGQLTFGDEKVTSLAIDETLISATLNAQNKIHLNLQTAIEQTNSINADIQIGSLNNNMPQLSGNVILSMPDLSWLQKPVPELDKISGSLELNAQLEGPLRQPLIGLNLDLVDAAVSYQPLGLVIDAIQLQGKSLPGLPLEAEGQFAAGEGDGHLNLVIQPDTNELMLTLQGSNLELFTGPALQLTASPDIGLTVAPDGYQINGRIDIPSALIKPPKGAGSQIRESEDVVLVNTTSPSKTTVEPDTAIEADPIPITGELIIALGDAVKVDADIAVTNLAGELTLNWQNQPIPIADGEIQLVDGRVQAYGQTLNLDNSRITYNQAPADSPRLSIRAVRDIFGDPRVVEAGVLVTGEAQEPNIRIFTEPATDEESALAYIATGNDFDHANGQGALNLGVYLLPKLFVSYGIGLFDNGNTANARYEFTERWNLSLQSGARDTGVDLNWRKDG